MEVLSSEHTPRVLATVRKGGFNVRISSFSDYYYNRRSVHGQAQDGAAQQRQRKFDKRAAPNKIVPPAKDPLPPPLPLPIPVNLASSKDAETGSSSAAGEAASSDSGSASQDVGPQLNGEASSGRDDSPSSSSPADGAGGASEKEQAGGGGEGQPSGEGATQQQAVDAATDVAETRSGGESTSETDEEAVRRRRLEEVQKKYEQKLRQPLPPRLTKLMGQPGAKPVIPPKPPKPKSS